MITRRRFVRVTTGALAAGPAFSSLAAAQATTVLRLNPIAPKTHFLTAIALGQWQKEVEAAASGALRIEIATAPLGPMPRTFDIAKSGIADISPGYHGAIQGRFPLMSLVEVPFLADSAEAVSVAAWRVFKRHLEKANEHEGVKLLTIWCGAPFHIYTKKGPIKSLDQLRGLKMIVASPSIGKMVEKFGAVVVFAPIAEWYDMIARGVVDGIAASHTSVAGWKLEDSVRYALLVPRGLAYSSFFIAMNQAKWDALPKPQQEALIGTAEERLARNIAGVFDDEDRKGLETVKKVGIEVSTADAGMLALMRDRLAFVDEEWVARANAKGIDGTAALKMLREEAGNYRPS